MLSTSMQTYCKYPNNEQAMVRLTFYWFYSNVLFLRCCGRGQVFNAFDYKHCIMLIQVVRKLGTSFALGNKTLWQYNSG